jgi:hypothetical protein
MAKITVVPAVTRIEVVQEEKVTITLSMKEVSVLMDVFGAIGGCPTTSRRSVIKGIDHALLAAGIERGNYNDSGKTGNIIFHD